MGSNLHCFINLSSTAAVDPSWGRGHSLDSSPVHHRPHWDKCVCFLQRRSSWTVSPLSGRSYRMEIQVAECLWFYIWFFWSDMAEFSYLLPQGPCLPWRFFFHRSCWYSNVFFGCILSFGRMSGCWSFMNSSTGVLIWFLLLSSVSPCFVSLLPSFSVFFCLFFCSGRLLLTCCFPFLIVFFFNPCSPTELCSYYWYSRVWAGVPTSTAATDQFVFSLLWISVLGPGVFLSPMLKCWSWELNHRPDCAWWLIIKRKNII